MRRYLPFCAVLVLGCGSRSGLLDVVQGDAAGAGGVVVVGGSGGLGGTGGFDAGAMGGRAGSDECRTLVLREPTVTVQKKTRDSVDLAPDLTRLTSSERVALAFVRNTLQGTDDFANVQRVAFSPWGVWPPTQTIDPAFAAFVSTSLVKELRISASLPDEIALLVALPNCMFSPHVPIEGDNTGMSQPMTGTVPTFVSAREPNQYLVGTATPNELFVTRLPSAIGVSGASIACASAVVVGSAVPNADGWLVAYSTGEGAAFGSCGFSPEVAGEPVRIDVAKVPADGAVEYLGGFAVESSVVGLQVAPHPDGIYIVWREASDNGESRIGWMRYLAASAGFVGPGGVTTPDDAPFEFAATAIGDRLAVAYVSDPANNPPDLVVRVLDESGALVVMQAFEPGSFFGRLAMLASPDGQSLLVGFDQQNGVTSRVDVARFDCVP